VQIEWHRLVLGQAGLSATSAVAYPFQFLPTWLSQNDIPVNYSARFVGSNPETREIAISYLGLRIGSSVRVKTQL
jgi:hypothetical protein